MVQILKESRWKGGHVFYQGTLEVYSIRSFANALFRTIGSDVFSELDLLDYSNSFPMLY